MQETHAGALCGKSELVNLSCQLFGERLKIALGGTALWALLNKNLQCFLISRIILKV